MEDQRDINTTAAPPLIAESLPQLPRALRCVLFESALNMQMVSSRSISKMTIISYYL